MLVVKGEQSKLFGVGDEAPQREAWSAKLPCTERLSTQIWMARHCPGHLTLADVGLALPSLPIDTKQLLYTL